jgi:DNA-binding NtrC family response regulator
MLPTLNTERLLEVATKEALTKTGGNRTEAAVLLNVSVRTLRNWINKYKLTKSHPPAKRV